MKTISIKLMAFLFLGILSVTVLTAQNSFDALTSSNSAEVVFGNLNLDDLQSVESNNLHNLEVDGYKSIDYYEEPADESVVVAFMQSMFAIGLGFGFGDSQSFWCFHAGYYFMLSQFSRSALYGVLAAVYEGASFNSGDFKRNLFDLQLKLLMFTAISQYAGWHLIYGILLGYGFGSEEYNDGFKTDITRLTIAAVVGFQLLLTSRIALAMHTNLLTYADTTFKPESGNEYSEDNTLFLLNKSSVFAISLLINLKRRARAE